LNLRQVEATTTTEFSLNAEMGLENAGGMYSVKIAQSDNAKKHDCIGQNSNKESKE
jgi:hypothetical protein